MDNDEWEWEATPPSHKRIFTAQPDARLSRRFGIRGIMLPFSSIALSRKVVLLFASCLSIAVLYPYVARSLRSTHIPVFDTRNGGKNFNGDDGGVEVVKMDGDSGEAIGTPDGSVNRGKRPGSKSGWTPGILAANLDDSERFGHSYDQIQAQIQDLRESWKPPKPQPAHFPPYEWYADENYDPNLWEGFEWENGYYINNGIGQLTQDPKPYLPYPEYNSPLWQSQWIGKYVACEGPRGKLLNESDDDVVYAFPTLPSQFPTPVIGDAEAVGIDFNHCFDREGRLGPYGHGRGVDGNVANKDRPIAELAWSEVQWAELQNQCFVSNRHRYRPEARRQIGHPLEKDIPLNSLEHPQESKPLAAEPAYHTRTAVLIRTWDNYRYTDNDLQSIRALITELSLFSGGEYQVFLFVDVKHSTSKSWNNSQVYQEVLKASVPAEFQGISILWNEEILQEWYPEVGSWDVYWHQFMPLQWFSKLHPEFDYIWNWEADARYTGNHYQFLDQVTQFAKNAARKYLWERNSRFYIPAAHGSYNEWLNNTHAIVESAIRNDNLDVVWGPQPYNATIQQPVGPTPPRSLDEDNFEWGVGEEADLVTLQPIWDPTYTLWAYRNKIFNFVPGVRPHFTNKDPLDINFFHSEFVNIPRRVYINTVSRFSRRLLHAMHLENLAGRTMQAEMWPATVSLHHGLKAVYAPHPIWADHRWPAWYMDAVFNADGNDTARWGSRSDSVYNQDREHNFEGWSWYFHSKFPRVLYRRWLGWSATTGGGIEYLNNPLRTLGGKQYEEEGLTLKIQPESAPTSGTFGGREIQVGGKGRMCLPAMLLHPIKNVYEDAGQRQSGRKGSVGVMDWWKALLHW